MKRIVAVLTTVIMLVLSTSVCFANVYQDPSFQMGQALGSAIGNAMGASAANRGRIKRNHHVVKDYMFEKSKRFVVATLAAPGAMIQDNSILNQASFVLYSLLKEKYLVFPQPFIIDHYFQNNPNAVNLPPEQRNAEIFKYIQNVSDSIIFIKVKDYYEQQGYAGVAMEITVFPHSRKAAVPNPDMMFLTRLKKKL